MVRVIHIRSLVNCRQPSGNYSSARNNRMIKTNHLWSYSRAVREHGATDYDVLVPWSQAAAIYALHLTPVVQTTRTVKPSKLSPSLHPCRRGKSAHLLWFKGLRVKHKVSPRIYFNLRTIYSNWPREVAGTTVENSAELCLAKFIHTALRSPNISCWASHLSRIAGESLTGEEEGACSIQYSGFMKYFTVLVCSYSDWGRCYVSYWRI